MASPPGAQAYPLTLSLENATFSDGGTASGSISLNFYGNLDKGIIVTTAGSVLPGQSFILPTSPAGNFSSGSIIDLYNGGYNITLHLVLVDDIGTTTAQTDQLVLSGASYECISFGCTGSNVRYFTAGDVQIPEPLPIAVFGAGLVGLVAARRWVSRPV